MKKSSLLHIMALGMATCLFQTATTMAADGTTRTDFDGDGLAEPTVYHYPSGTWHIDFDDKYTSQPNSVQWGWPGIRTMRGDFDGDGKADYCVYDRSTGYWYVTFNSGGMARVKWGWWTASPQTGDFDGDGRTDIAAYEPSTGKWYIKCSGTHASCFANGGGYAVTWGWSEAKPVPGDYDGDGMTDVAVYHQAAGDWYIKFSSGSAAKVKWGGTLSAPVPGDYNGDGKTDLAVYCSAYRSWYIKYAGDSVSTFSNVSYVIERWGWSEAVPAPDDYDGDGVDDIALYLQSAGEWYIKYSSGGTAKVNWGGKTFQAIGQ